MSGRHRVVKPSHRFGLGLATMAALPRMVWHRAQAGWAMVARSWRRLIKRATDHFTGDDPWAGVHFDAQAMSSDPVPAPVTEPEPAPLVLDPEQVLPVMHTQRPDLPGSSVRWHVHQAGVHGEVNALDVGEDGQRRIVNAYAAALHAPVYEDDDGRLVVSTTGLFGEVPVTVAAFFVNTDTMPLPAYREAAGCLETQHIPGEVLAEVVA